MRKENNKGYTLLEVIVSVLIFTMVMSVFMILLTTGLKIKKSSERITENHNVAANAIEGTTGVPNESSDVTIPIKYSGVTKITMDGKYYTYGLGNNKYLYFKPN